MIPVDQHLLKTELALYSVLQKPKNVINLCHGYINEMAPSLTPRLIDYIKYYQNISGKSIYNNKTNRNTIIVTFLRYPADLHIPRDSSQGYQAVNGTWPYHGGFFSVLSFLDLGSRINIHIY